ncbi:MAG: methyltransferase domain-containing protein [candidate division KSB1 bacterium]|nr:methyltransferase domain-containing protein [candidate division KSB1 bacterium]
MLSEKLYWTTVAGAWEENSPHSLWRRHSDAVNSALVTQWLPEPIGRLLKTDLFDEATGDGVYPALARKARTVVGIDISPLTTRRARREWPACNALVADVRYLPFADNSFDAVFSNSPLDHFRSVDEISTSLKELQRVLRPGGTLLLTMDNLANPAIALRQALPFRLLDRMGLVPYYVGVTSGPKGLPRLVGAAGLEPNEVGAVMHCPRFLAVAMAGLLQRFASLAAQTHFLRTLMAFERLARWPTRFLSGYFVAGKATKREPT